MLLTIGVLVVLGVLAGRRIALLGGGAQKVVVPNLRGLHAQQAKQRPARRRGSSSTR